MANSKFSDYVVYVDESGDHSLENINAEYPLFVLAFCVFNKQSYINDITPAITTFKFNHFGHDMIVLHEHEIRKAQNGFALLTDQEIRNVFMDELNKLIYEAPFTIVSTIIDKRKLKEKYPDPANPYHLALSFGLEGIYSFLKNKQQIAQKTHIVFECRGKKEDKDLELEFRRVCGGQNKWGTLPFDIVFADKKTNSCGLQLADLIARPIGRYMIDSNQNNRAYSLIQGKFYCDADGNKNDLGLKCFP